MSRESVGFVLAGVGLGGTYLMVVYFLEQAKVKDPAVRHISALCVVLVLAGLIAAVYSVSSFVNGKAPC